MTARRMIVISRWAASITTAAIAACALISSGAHAQEAGGGPDRDGGFRGIKNVVLVHGAFAPDQGESLLDLLGAYPTPIGNELIVDQFGFITLTTNGVREHFAQDMTDTEQTVIAAVQGPTSVAAFITQITTTAWKLKPTWYVVAQEDRTISPDLERLFARRMNATTIEMPTSHVPILSRPSKIAAFISRAARDLR